MKQPPLPTHSVYTGVCCALPAAVSTTVSSSNTSLSKSMKTKRFSDSSHGFNSESKLNGDFTDICKGMCPQTLPDQPKKNCQSKEGFLLIIHQHGLIDQHGLFVSLGCGRDFLTQLNEIIDAAKTHWNFYNQNWNPSFFQQWGQELNISNSGYNLFSQIFWVGNLAASHNFHFLPMTWKDNIEVPALVTTCEAFVQSQVCTSNCRRIRSWRRLLQFVTRITHAFQLQNNLRAREISCARWTTRLSYCHDFFPFHFKCQCCSTFSSFLWWQGWKLSASSPMLPGLGQCAGKLQTTVFFAMADSLHFNWSFIVVTLGDLRVQTSHSILSSDILITLFP